MVKTLTIQHVSNTVVTKDIKSKVVDALEKEIETYKLPVKSKIQLDTTLDVIARIIKLENDSSQGRRYGHPMLDIAREINRYFSPSLIQAGNAQDVVCQEAIEEFLNALGLTRGDSPNDTHRNVFVLSKRQST